MDIILELSNTQYSYEMIIIENIMDITQNVKWIQKYYSMIQTNDQNIVNQHNNILTLISIYIWLMTRVY